MDQPKVITNMDKLFSLLRESYVHYSPLYRGHSRDSYEIKSSAVRRMINSYKVVPTYTSLIDYHVETLLDSARSMNYHIHKSGKQLSDLELLASLQHQGAATALIDFSKSIAVALWFASRNVECDGALYIIEDATDTFLFRRANQGLISTQLISDILRETEEKLMIWEPPGVHTRVLQQDSVFIFGLNEAMLNIRSHKYIIAKEVKRECVELLDKSFNINLSTLFKDFDGFALANSQHNTLANTEGKKYDFLGNLSFQKGEFSEAIRYYQKAHDHEPLSLQAIEKLGKTEVQMRNTDKAIRWFEKILELSPNNHEIERTIKKLSNLSNKLKNSNHSFEETLKIAIAYNSLSKHNIAIEYYDKCIALNPKDGNVYHNKGIALAHLEQYKNAIECYKISLVICPNNWKCCISMSHSYTGLGNISKAETFKLFGDEIKQRNLEKVEELRSYINF